MNKIIALFGIIFLVFAIVVFFQINAKTIDKLLNNSPKSSVSINSASFMVDVAKTQTELMNGLSGRNSLPKDQGMLFVFDKPANHSFWMRGMKFPLDILFIKDKKVVKVFENVQPAASGDNNPPQFGSDVESDMVLEINAGLAKKYKIKDGDAVTIEIK